MGMGTGIGRLKVKVTRRGQETGHRPLYSLSITYVFYRPGVQRRMRKEKRRETKGEKLWTCIFGENLAEQLKRNYSSSSSPCGVACHLCRECSLLFSVKIINMFSYVCQSETHISERYCICNSVLLAMEDETVSYLWASLGRMFLLLSF